MTELAHKRRHIRFAPDSGDFVQIDLDPSRSEFKGEVSALLVDESMGGFSIACLKSVGLKKGTIYQVKVGRLSPLKAELVWSLELDDKVNRLGFQFIDEAT